MKLPTPWNCKKPKKYERNAIIADLLIKTNKQWFH